MFSTVSGELHVNIFLNIFNFKKQLFVLLILYIGICIVNFILNKYYFYQENACPFFIKTFCLIDFYFNFYLVYNVEAFLMVVFFILIFCLVSLFPIFLSSEFSLYFYI